MRFVVFFSRPLRFIVLGALLLVALKAVEAQTTAAGSTPGSFRVTETGAAEYRIAIRVPPGVAGMEPKLALVYNSQAGNGLLGVGWNLEGLSAITRCPRTRAQDGSRGGINYNWSDRFCLDGERLVMIAGASYGAEGAEYRTERERYSRIVSYGVTGNGPTRFRVWTKSGQILDYGDSPDSRIPAVGTGTVKVWAVSKVADTKGNYLSATYSGYDDTANPQYQPVRIDYSGNAPAAVSVRFVYEARPDWLTRYSAGTLARTTSRLNRIQVLSGASPLHEYRLAYDAGATQRSRLLSVTECLGDGSACLAPTSFARQDGGVSMAAAWSGQPGTDWASWPSARVVTGDFNGDGKTDVAVMADSLGGIGTYLSNGDGTFTPVWSGQSGTDWGSWPSAKPVTGDFNGDGLTDIAICMTGGGGIGTYLSNGNGTFSPAWSGQTGTDWCSWPSARPVAGDFNGDGLTDIAVGADNLGGLGVYLSNGNGTFSPAWSGQTGTDWASWPSAKPVAGDFNGDGLADIAICMANGGGIGTYLANGNGTFSPVYSGQPGTDWCSWPSARPVAGDFNGDGLTDIAVGADNLGGIGVYLALGNGSFAPAWSGQPGTDWGSWPSAKPLAGDFDGDGLTDIAICMASGGGVGVYISNGNGTFRPAFFDQTGTDWASWPSARPRAGDFKGTGKTGIAISANSLGGIGSYQPAAPFPDLITSVAGSLGTVTSITHKPAADASVYARTAGASFPVVDVQIPLQVVSSTSSSDALGGSLVTSYFYTGARANLHAGFLGFRKVEATDVQTGIKSGVSFRQDYPYHGLPIQSVASRPAGALIAQTDSTWTDVLLSAAPGSGGSYHKSELTSSVQRRYELGGGLVTTVTASTSYDGYGNPTTVLVGTGDGFSKTTTNLYANDTASWFLGRLLRSAVQSTAP